MDSLLLSRITKDFLNLDPDIVPPKDRYRAGWTGSILMSHQKARLQKKKRDKVDTLLGERKRYARFRKIPVNLSTAPKLEKPIETPEGQMEPAWVFSRGDLDNDKSRNPEPIRYLLVETNEFTKARPVPGNTRLLRSLCKGKGKLKKNAQGLFYLDVDNRFVNMMLPYLQNRHLVRPPYFNLFREPDGAHIPIIPAREASFQYLDEIEEIGEEFTFEIEGLYSMKPTLWPEVDEVWFFKIHSPELERLRKRYFLPEHPNGHPFHLTVAVKTNPHRNATRPIQIMRINSAILAA